MTTYIVLRETPGVGPSCEIVDGAREAASALAACRAVALELDQDAVVLYAVPQRNWQRYAFGVETQRRVVAR